LKEIFQQTYDNTLKAKICLDLLKYIYPQRKAVDVELGENTTTNLKVAALKIQEALKSD